MDTLDVVLDGRVGSLQLQNATLRERAATMVEIRDLSTRCRYR